MFEMPYAGENHGDAVLIGSRDDFFIAHGAARLNHCRNSMLCGFVNTITKREEGV